MLFALLAIVSLGVAGQPADAGERYGKKETAVYHISYESGEDGRAYHVAMRNIQNHINAVGAEKRTAHASEQDHPNPQSI